MLYRPKYKCAMCKEEFYLKHNVEWNGENYIESLLSVLCPYCAGKKPPQFGAAYFVGAEPVTDTTDPFAEDDKAKGVWEEHENASL